MNTKGINWDNFRLFLALARQQSALEAAQQLDVDHSTLTRRIRRLETQMATQLFERSSAGHVLTPAGHRLLEHVESIEGRLVLAESEVGGGSYVLSGQVRLGATEGFGSYFLAPQMAHFCDLYPSISVELLPVPRFVNLSKREADLAINIERPQGLSQVVCKLSDYRLRLYASRSYLAQYASIQSVSDLTNHRFIGYVDELCFSAELRYQQDIAPNSSVPFRSTSIVAQYLAAKQGRGLSILPCFLASDTPDLVSVLDDQIDIIRTFWLAAPSDRRELARVRTLWDYLRRVTEENRSFLMGETPHMKLSTQSKNAPFCPK